ncbi:MAG: glutamine synthetase III, partial [Clostridia bacterium]|nr:glutamine synthetase III [Clostridia bacterium]
MSSVPELFGSMVFNDSVMKDKLPRDIYKSVKKTIEMGQTLNPEVANVVASAMKDWALSKGATHYTHWFQPMTGITAEKHDSFITPTEGGRVIMDFSGKELIKGESDASSFPSGGLRTTFEARGYTAWDPTSYAFVKDGTLCIPTVFCSYTGEVLDKKTPLLRSMHALNLQALRILHLFGQTNVRRVTSTVGPEQEYFLVDKKLHDQRKDLIFTGRTLFGAKPPKGQELDDHYFGVIKPRVAAYMADLDEELWRLGILAKTKHNEAAPAQHELAPIFTTTNISTDHNQLTMEVMRKVALKHGLVCLLHEKPFEGVNGSGKHNNWSMSTDTGVNLFDPGDTPAENAQFLLFLAAVIKAVDEHQDLMRASVAYAGNDHRLGAHEAPPAIISLFLGSDLERVLDAIVTGAHYEESPDGKMDIGVDVLPKIPMDNTDRNRTSPLAFTGNKFEFRALGSSQSIAGPNTVLNTIMADVLKGFADELEQAEDFYTALTDLIKRTIKEHQRIIFDGDCYSEEWKKHSAKLGILNLETTVDALPVLVSDENISLFERHHVYSEVESRSRYTINLEIYVKYVNIEALTAIEMLNRQIVPAVLNYEKKVADSIVAKKAACPGLACTAEVKLLQKLDALSAELAERTEALEAAVAGAGHSGDAYAEAKYYRDEVLTAMRAVRITADALEPLLGENDW